MFYQQKQTNNIPTKKTINNGGATMNRLEQYVCGKVSQVNPQIVYVNQNKIGYSFNISKTLQKSTEGFVFYEQKKSTVARNGEMMNVCISHRELVENEREQLISELLDKSMETMSKVYYSLQKEEEVINPIITPPSKTEEDLSFIDSLIEESIESMYKIYDSMQKIEEHVNPIIIPPNNIPKEEDILFENNNNQPKPQICWWLFIAFILSLSVVVLNHKIHVILDIVKQISNINKEEVLIVASALIALCLMWINDKINKIHNVNKNIWAQIHKSIINCMEVGLELLIKINKNISKIDKYSIVINLWFKFACRDLVNNYKRLNYIFGMLYCITMYKLGIPKEIVIRVW